MAQNTVAVFLIPVLASPADKRKLELMVKFDVILVDCAVRILAARKLEQHPKKVSTKHGVLGRAYSV